MAKKLAPSTQLKNALAQIEKLEKELKNSESMKDTYRLNADRAEKEIEQINQFLDAVPNTIARESDHENNWERVKRSVVTRMGAWLASK